MIVGTHADSTTPQSLGFAESTVSKLKSSYHEIVGHIMLSCKNIKEIEALQNRLTSIAMEHKLLKTPVPMSFIRLEEYLYNHALTLSANAQPPIISWTEFQQIAVKHKLTLQIATTAARFLHNIGSIIYFDDRR